MSFHINGWDAIATMWVHFDFHFQHYYFLILIFIWQQFWNFVIFIAFIRSILMKSVFCCFFLSFDKMILLKKAIINKLTFLCNKRHLLIQFLLFAFEKNVLKNEIKFFLFSISRSYLIRLQGYFSNHFYFLLTAPIIYPQNLFEMNVLFQLKMILKHWFDCEE